MKRRKQNKIKALMIDGDEWCFDDDIVKNHAIDYFSKLNIVGDHFPGDFPVKGWFPKLEESLVTSLVSLVNRDEVRSVMFSMAPLKVPRVDDYHAKFY